MPAIDRATASPGAVVLEGVGVAVAGLALALLANELSPRGLVLSRDYFPSARDPASTNTAAGSSRPTDAGTARGAEADRLAAEPQAEGLHVLDTEAVLVMFNDPRREQGLFVFVDARDDRHYQEGHIPGAFQLDRFYPDRYLPEALPACLAAEKIVVYCNGGDCEDSKFVARLLRDATVQADRLFVFVGGIEDWQARGELVERGSRNSGDLQRATP